MNYYLVDYENVRTQGLNGVNKLSEEDIVCIFYTEHADSLTFGLHRRLNESKATILFRRVIAGYKNALDFQLSSYLGYIICENAENQYDYCIVSQDKGYESLVDYWKKRRVNISLVTNVVKQKEQPLQDKAEPQTADSLKNFFDISAGIQQNHNTKDNSQTQSNEPPSFDKDTKEDLQNPALEKQGADPLKDTAVAREPSVQNTPDMRNAPQTKTDQLLFFDKMIREYLQNQDKEEQRIHTAGVHDLSVRNIQEIRNDPQTKTGQLLFLNEVLQEYFQSDIILEEKETAPASSTPVVPVTVKQKKQTMVNDLEKKVAKLIKNKSDAPAVAKILQNCETKMELNNALMKKFPSKNHKKTSEIYTALKPLIADKKGN